MIYGCKIIKKNVEILMTLFIEEEIAYILKVTVILLTQFYNAPIVGKYVFLYQAFLYWVTKASGRLYF